MATGWSTQAKNSAVDTVGKNSGNLYVAAFTDAACTTEVTGGAYTRKLCSYPDAASGATTTPTCTLDIPQAITVRGLGRFATASGGTAYDARALTTPEVFGSAGKLDVTNTITAS